MTGEESAAYDATISIVAAAMIIVPLIVLAWMLVARFGRAPRPKRR